MAPQESVMLFREQTASASLPGSLSSSFPGVTMLRTEIALFFFVRWEVTNESDQCLGLGKSV